MKLALKIGARPLAIAGALSVMVGCSGGMIPGSIYSNDGRVLSFEIEKAQRTGAVKAKDPTTGETFTGTYVGVRERVDVATSGTAISGWVVASGFGTGSAQSNMANATAYLKGNKGSMLNCRMRIEAAFFSPHGLGSCVDKQGRKYRLQF